jgi:outer membrane protein OmpA-like peptidoglycan-associated protein
MSRFDLSDVNRSLDMASGGRSVIDGLSPANHTQAAHAPQRALGERRLHMRASLFAALGLASLIATGAHAGPAYKAETVADFFAKAALGKSRTICFGTAADCPAQAAETAKFDLLVNFDFDSDRLTAAAKENLDEFAKALHDPRLKGEKFEIDGHTDATGAETYNLGLSERRAAAVVGYLASQGVDAGDLTAKGFGKTKPRVADPFSPENRRVETHLLEQP